ncbi:MAG: hypothetical protein FJW27_16760 [Acidimicrobiia bacterium]|nr:hypothetical protein [Acidimicrobiia bacterium]
MLQRPTLTPALSAGDDVKQEHVAAHVRQWQADTDAIRARIQALRQQVEATSRQLENPKGALEYLDFFDGFFLRASEELAAIAAALPAGFTTAHGDTLRQLASNAAAESRRTVIFRDKWVNKPLPYEQTRPMLTQIANDVRDQLQDYREMTQAAAHLTALNPPPPLAPSELTPEGLGRRELFSKLVRPLGETTEQ